MSSKISDRLLDIIDAMPLFEGARVLEIGCGPGAAAREILKRIGDGYVLAIDRSAKAIEQAKALSKEEINSGRLSFKLSAAEDFNPESSEPLFDLVLAVRVGALDGRHPEIEEKVHSRINAVLKKGGKLFVDGKETKLKR